jgi:hypothetical protein
MSRRDRKRRYETLLACIDKHTDADKPAVTERAVRVTLVADGSLSLDAYLSAGRAAQQNGELVSGSGYLARTDSAALLRSATAYVADEADDPQQFVKRANRLLQEKD